MSTHSNTSRRLSRIALGVLAIAATVGACDGASTETGLVPQQLLVPGDTIPGTGQLSELQQRRAAWVARGISNYRVELRISCFCGGDITRPVIIEVRAGAITSVVDPETSKPVTNTSAYLTVTGLFDAAIAERSKGGNVSVAYDRTLGVPVRLEVGTVANDAGVLYFLSGLVTDDR
jgi:uncharacterized protein DUF6174